MATVVKTKKPAKAPVEKAEDLRPISVLSFKVVGATKEQRDRWKRIGLMVRGLTNAIYRIWMCEHVAAGNDAVVRAYMQASRSWNQAINAAAEARNLALKGASKAQVKTVQAEYDAHVRSLGPKPKCPIKFITPEIQSHIGASLTEAYPLVNSRIKELLMNVVLGTFKSRKGENSAFPAWMLALADEAGLPASIRLQPIPFDSRNAGLSAPTDTESDYCVTLRVDRFMDGAKNRATSTEDVLKLQTRGKAKKLASHVASLKSVIEDPAYKFCGSRLVFKQSTGEFFVKICYREPVQTKPELDPAKIATLTASDSQPFVLQLGEKQISLGGRTGRHVFHVRRQLLTQRWARQEAFRHASSARKGHGRKRATGKYFVLSNRWKDYVKTVNQMTVKHLCDILVEHGVGTVVYEQPADHFAATRFLTVAGKVEGRQDSTSWDWYQLGNILQVKAAKLGINVKVVKNSGEVEAQE